MRSDDRASGPASIRTATPTLDAQGEWQIGAATSELAREASCGGSCVENMQRGDHHPRKYHMEKSTSTLTAPTR